MPKIDKQEKQIAKKLKGKTQSNSGGTRFGGGDVHTKSFFIEAKCHVKETSSFAIKKEWLKKAKEQAFEQGKSNWVLAFRYSEDSEDYYVLPENEFEEYVNLKEDNLEEENNND